MPPTNPPGRLAFAQELADLRTAITALETQQNRVITDPTGATGDPANNHATVVEGWLKPITGIAAYGIASYKTGAWVRIA